MHISGLLADLMNQTPVTEANFKEVEGKILLILPDQDFFSGKISFSLCIIRRSNMFPAGICRPFLRWRIMCGRFGDFWEGMGDSEYTDIWNKEM